MNLRPFRIETLVLGCPLNVTTGLAPGLSTITSTLPPHVISNVPKCLVGSAFAIATGSRSVATNVASRSLITTSPGCRKISRIVSLLWFSVNSGDDTPGCTAQACGIRDVWGELERKGAVVLGVSPDSPKKHAKFREKYGLPFTLLSDEDHAVAEAYATWIEKSMYGKKYMGMERSTFVIDADGNVASIMRKVKPADHADDVLAALP